jgi:GNAT superfamily N-acetyltransferase
MYNLVITEFDLTNLPQRNQLAEFCERCARLGIENNSSLERLKIDTFKSRDLKYWLALDTVKNKVVGIAGAHRLPEMGVDCFRILFRGCILPEYRGRGVHGLSKGHRNSFLFRYVTPLQIQWARGIGGKQFVITTNVSVQGGASPTDRLFHRLERQGVVRKTAAHRMLFSTLQNVWTFQSDFSMGPN